MKKYAFKAKEEGVGSAATTDAAVVISPFMMVRPQP